MKIEMENRSELRTWMQAHRDAGRHSFFSVKGPPPEGATYSEFPDTKIKEINVSWVCAEASGPGRVFNCIYKPDKNE